jgi:hypothetical protein
MTEHGWTNADTWHLQERVQTEERLHAARQAMLDALGQAVTADDVRRFFVEEMAGDPEAPVDFAQLAAEWERERRFRRDLLGRS